jgi:ABC-2 type transport system ATP-binding protein
MTRARGEHAAGDAAVELRGICKSYGGVVALAGIDLVIGVGERVALLGPNGSGKSTLLKILCLAIGPDRAGGASGESTPTARCLGNNLLDERGARRHLANLGVVFQHPGLDGLLTVRENLRLAGALVGLSGSTLAARVDAVAQEMGIADRLESRVRTLSGGLVRRADVARALLHSPRLVLLDEPTTGLDVIGRAEFMGVLDRIAGVGNDAGATTVVLCTHMMDEAERMDRVVMLDRGRVVLDGAPGALRGALGPRVIRVRADEPALVSEAAALSAAGLERRRDGSGMEVLVTPDGDGARLERGAAVLLASGASFEIGAPSLADAFIAATGRPLGTRGDDAGEDAAGRARGGGRRGRHGGRASARAAGGGAR